MLGEKQVKGKKNHGGHKQANNCFGKISTNKCEFITQLKLIERTGISS